MAASNDVGGPRAYFAKIKTEVDLRLFFCYLSFSARRRGVCARHRYQSYFLQTNAEPLLPMIEIESAACLGVLNVKLID
jgi:hypothetical protein